MFRFLLKLVLTSTLVLSAPVYADDQEEGVFSRSWRGFKSMIGMDGDTAAGQKGYKADRDDDDEDRYHDKEKASKSGKDAKQKHAKDAEAELEAIRRNSRFSEEQARRIRAALGYQDDGDQGTGKKPKKLPPGLKKKLERGGELPPGWKMKFARGEVVSDEVWAQSHALPADLVGQIGTIAGTELIQVNDRVARVLTSTREILDVIDLVTGP